MDTESRICLANNKIVLTIINCISYHFTLTDDKQSETLELWKTMLKGPLRALLTVSPSLSAAVCDCLANLDPITYTQLPVRQLYSFKEMNH